MFLDKPILNSPYYVPTQHHVLDDHGQPTNREPRRGRRRSGILSPVPKPKPRTPDSDKFSQSLMDFREKNGQSFNDQEYQVHTIINEIRDCLVDWRKLSPSDWNVTHTTSRLLKYWRNPNFVGVRPFFCQIEAIETIIWLTEVARTHHRYKRYWNYLVDSNKEINPNLLRIATKMATGTGKTTVMAMLIAWQTLNSIIMPGNASFSKGFLIIAPGITIKDRLRVLDPNDPENYYKKNNIVPTELLHYLDKAEVKVINYHVFQKKTVVKLNNTTKKLLKISGGGQTHQKSVHILKPKKKWFTEL